MFYSPDSPPRPSQATRAHGFTIVVARDHILVTGRGLWTVAEIDRHFDALTEELRRTRAAGRPVRVLVDLRNAGAQTGEVEVRIGARTRIAYLPGERVAIVVGSCLAKIAMRRVVRTAQHAYFLSPDAALTWLTAYDTPKPNAAG